jgi:hypothetical protein
VTLWEGFTSLSLIDEIFTTQRIFSLPLQWLNMIWSNKGYTLAPHLHWLVWAVLYLALGFSFSFAKWIFCLLIWNQLQNEYYMKFLFSHQNWTEWSEPITDCTCVWSLLGCYFNIDYIVVCNLQSNLCDQISWCHFLLFDLSTKWCSRLVILFNVDWNHSVVCCFDCLVHMAYGMVLFPRENQFRKSQSIYRVILVIFCLCLCFCVCCGCLWCW